MANLIPYPYYNSTKEVSGIIYDLHPGGEIVVNGTATGMARFYIAYSYDVDLPAGTYTIRGTGVTGSSYYLYIRRKSTHTYLTSYTVTWDQTFTLSEDCEAMLYIVVNPGTTMHGVVLQPQIVSGSTLPDWEPYKEPTTIDAENAKQIRRSMDILIQVTPETGDPIVITNDNLISCIVSLRSDLSILEPTLPESEINIEAYMDEDISETLAAIPDETPITYQAGYDDDMSPVRNFYLAEQITWADNVMSIHGVDAVHKLDEEIPAPLNVQSEPNTYRITRPDLTGIYHAICYMLGSVGIDYAGYVSGDFDRGNSGGDVGMKFVIRKKPRREIIAALMNLLHINFAAGSFAIIDSFWPVYVDAGIPTLTIEKPTSSADIYEEDCGEVQRNVDRQLTGIDLTWESIAEDAYYSRIIGSATMQKDSGVFVNLDSEFTWRYRVAAVLDQKNGTSQPVPPVYEGVAGSYTAYEGIAQYGDNSVPSYCCLMLGPNIPKGVIVGPSDISGIAGRELYTQVMPWNSGTTNAWNAIGASSDVATMDVDIYGQAYEPVAEKYSYGTAGRVASIAGEDLFLGVLHTRGAQGSGMSNTEILPGLGYESLLQRSNVTGSFIWKGDPRMQPRDVVTFHRLDGTDELITLENITITHEGGGTSAEITYRKGIC